MAIYVLVLYVWVPWRHQISLSGLAENDVWEPLDVSSLDEDFFGAKMIWDKLKMFLNLTVFLQVIEEKRNILQKTNHEATRKGQSPTPANIKVLGKLLI